MSQCQKTQKRGFFAFDFCPKGWIAADGSILKISEHISLFGLIGTVFGGDGESTFAVPDMRSTAIAGVTSGKLNYGTPGSLGSVITITEGEADESSLKAVQLTVCIANIGIFPAR